MAPKVAIPCLKVQKCDHSTVATPIIILVYQYVVLQAGVKRNAQNKHAPVRISRLNLRMSVDEYRMKSLEVDSKMTTQSKLPS